MCSKAIKGRSDKKFCSDNCRVAFNNQTNNGKNLFVKNVNSILIKNRKILEEFSSRNVSSVSKMVMLQKGFNFHFFTNMSQSENGGNSYFCYDHGYYTTHNETCVLLKQKEY
ncbi:MAG: hypothetical protein J0I09_13975 [Sphingobacteriia bacterium]|nr:hypothetical protein [Sphingobacteriia bacterium]